MTCDGILCVTCECKREELRELGEKLASLEDATRRLRNEVRGTLYAHEMAIRYDSGNSNWTCLEMALDKVDEALAKIRGEK